MIVGFAVNQEQIGQLAITKVVKGMVRSSVVMERDGTNVMDHL